MAAKRVTQIDIVSSLGNSVYITNGAEVVDIEITTTDGKILKRSLIAGEDTSEEAWDRPDVSPVIKHARAKIFESFDVTDATGKIFQGHDYLAL